MIPLPEAEHIKPPTPDTPRPARLHRDPSLPPPDDVDVGGCLVLLEEHLPSRDGADGSQGRKDHKALLRELGERGDGAEVACEVVEDPAVVLAKKPVIGGAIQSEKLRGGRAQGIRSRARAGGEIRRETMEGDREEGAGEVRRRSPRGNAKHQREGGGVVCASRTDAPHLALGVANRRHVHGDVCRHVVGPLEEAEVPKAIPRGERGNGLFDDSSAAQVAAAWGWHGHGHAIRRSRGPWRGLTEVYRAMLIRTRSPVHWLSSG